MNENEHKRTMRDFGWVAAKGAAMGAADVVPGVSGGTIAFITGIYEELLDGLRAFGGEGLRRLLARDLKGSFEAVHGGFLIALFTGILASVATLSRGVLWALEHHGELLWAFFLGLLLGAVVVVGRQISQWRPATIGNAVLGTLVAWLITGATPASTSDSTLFIFVTGVVAICAMLLPGISGSFILVLMGKYETILGALKNFDLAVVLAFAAGCGTGLLAFSHLLSWLFRRFHDATVALICGFLVGSMRKLWPWKHALETYVDRHGVVKPLVEENVLPGAYLELTGRDPQLWGAVVLACVGLVVVVAIDRAGRKTV